MKDFRGIELNIGDTVAAMVNIGNDSTKLELGIVIGFSKQLGTDVCIIKYHPRSGFAPTSTIKQTLHSGKVAKL